MAARSITAKTVVRPGRRSQHRRAARKSTPWRAAERVARRKRRRWISRTVDFQLSPDQCRLRQRCLELAADFAVHSAAHDRDASHPTENYDRLRTEGFLELTIAPAWGGAGASFLDHTIAYEALGQGCPSTALAFTMHRSLLMPVLPR